MMDDCNDINLSEIAIHKSFKQRFSEILDREICKCMNVKLFLLWSVLRCYATFFALTKHIESSVLSEIHMGVLFSDQNLSPKAR